jgi:hypothetical protein
MLTGAQTTHRGNLIGQEEHIERIIPSFHISPTEELK